MRATEGFPWLPIAPSESDTLPILHRAGQRTIYSYLHFSNYGKFQKRLEAEARVIASLLPRDG